MWTGLLDRMLRHIVRKGTLGVTMPDGTTRRYGQGAPEYRVTLKTPDLPRKIILNPTLALGEAYMDGTLEVQNDDLSGFFQFMIPNFNDAGVVWFQTPLKVLRYSLRRLRQFAPVGTAQANVSYHYDLSRTLYDLFLDADRQYSCAYWGDGAETLEAAQSAKKHHIARKLRLEPGMRVLDIGCGWGGMALTLARDYGAEVVGVTLSKEQHVLAVQRVRDAGLEDQVDIRMADYRTVCETFDRIVSVGMLEHVGVPQYDEYFKFVHDHLNETGLALIHSIGHVGPANESDPWIAKHIFPGAYTPALNEIQKSVDRHYLISADIEALRLHYARTLRAWYDRFMLNEDKARALYDARFVRMWRWYLLTMEASFTVGRMLVYQLQLSKTLEAAPITRAYLYRDGAEAPAAAAVPAQHERAAE